MIDWSDQITNDSLLRLIAANFPIYWESLDVGTIQWAKIKRSFRTPIKNYLLDQQNWLGAEWFGGVVDRADPVKKWDSYLSIGFRENRELTICSSGADFSIAKILQFIAEVAKLGSIGYGYGDDWDESGLAYYIAGITYGLPKSDEEKRRADQLSRWFRERLSMSNNPPRKRYLEGMYRGVYQINVLNRSHIVEGSGGLQLKEMDHLAGKLLSCGNETFIWSVSKSDLKAAEQDLSGKGLLI